MKPTFIAIYDINDYFMYININLIESIHDDEVKSIYLGGEEMQIQKHSFDLLMESIDFINVKEEK